eukprot:SAG22_NODE_376_length_11537_cov_29.420353_3_plen_377_part_00
MALAALRRRGRRRVAVRGAEPERSGRPERGAAAALGCLLGDTEVLAVLLAAGSDPNRLVNVDGGGYSALHMAAHHGQAACCQLLARHRATDFNLLGGTSGETALSMAVGAADAASVAALLGGRAAQPGDQSLLPAVDWAAPAGAAQTMGGQPTVLHAAAATGDPAAAVALLSALLAHMPVVASQRAALLDGGGGGGGHRNGWATTPVGMASAAGNGAAVSLLVQAGADLEAEVGGGKTELQAAAYAGDTDAVYLLTAAGAVPSRADRFGRTPLHGAARRGAAETVAALLAAGADADAADQNGETPLHWCAQEAGGAAGGGWGARLDATALGLLRAGADPGRLNKHGMPPDLPARLLLRSTSYELPVGDEDAAKEDL